MSRRPRVVIAALVVALALMLALVLTLAGPSSKRKPESRPADGASAQSSGFDGAPITDSRPESFELTDQQGRRVSLRGYRGKVVVLTFLSTASTISRLMAQQIRGALEEVGEGASALAVSIDPRADTGAHVRAFLNRVSLTGRLEYLTGTAAQLRAVWRAYQIVPPTAGEKGPDRAAYVVLIGKQGEQRVRFYVEQLTPEALAHDIRKLRAG